jgi:hypothetical protein
MTHGVSGIDWRHYKHPLPERVHDMNMQLLGGCGFKPLNVVAEQIANYNVLIKPPLMTTGDK